MVNLAPLMCSLCLDSLGELSQLSAGVYNFQHKIRKKFKKKKKKKLLQLLQKLLW